ncbi:MAG: esterase/lipase family protein [Chlamydiales bacterium]
MNKIVFIIIIFLALHLEVKGVETVVCTHGFFRSSKCMIPIGSMLKSEGYNVCLWDYQSRKKTIEGHAEDLICVLQQIAVRNPGEPIHFVTHSLGGVIVRAAVSHPDCPQEAKIGKAILLAPPNSGSCFARTFREWKPVQWIFGQRSGRQLLNYTADEMHALGTFPETMDVVVIAGDKGTDVWFSTPNDGKVSVNETYLRSPHTHLTILASHRWIMTSRWTLNFVKEYLLWEGSYPPKNSPFIID